MKTLIRSSLLLLLVIGIREVYLIARRSLEPLQEIEYKLTSTSIAEVIENPGKFTDEITVSGRVTQSINVLGLRCYKLADSEDAASELLVIPKKSSVPREGTLLKVRGHVRQLLKVGEVELVSIQAVE